MKTLLVAFCLLIATPVVYAIDLTGVWHGNDDGTYYIRQVGSEIWWFGERMPAWSNVAHGKISDSTVTLTWGDVPKGHIMQSGILVLRVVAPNKLEVSVKTGGFGGSVWTR